MEPRYKFFLMEHPHILAHVDRYDVGITPTGRVAVRWSSAGDDSINATDVCTAIRRGITPRPIEEQYWEAILADIHNFHPDPDFIDKVKRGEID
jgi:hypothetical protein